MTSRKSFIDSNAFICSVFSRKYRPPLHRALGIFCFELKARNLSDANRLSVTLSSSFSLSCCSKPTLRCWTRGVSDSGTMSSIKKSSTKKVFSSFCWVSFGPWSLATILSFFIIHPRTKVSLLGFAQKAFACYFSSAFTARSRGLQGLLGYY